MAKTVELKRSQLVHLIAGIREARKLVIKGDNYSSIEELEGIIEWLTAIRRA